MNINIVISVYMLFYYIREYCASQMIPRSFRYYNNYWNQIQCRRWHTTCFL